MIQILRMDASYLTHQLLIFISFLKSPELVEFNFSENELSQVRHPPMVRESPYANIMYK